MPTILLCSSAYADWATEMFQDTSHNFGTVARGADTQFQFVFQNKFVEDVVIESVHSSCRCTTPTYDKKVIKTWEKGVVNIKLDTRNFSGRKDATVTVRFSKPFYAEVQLHSYCSIRTDVSVQPGNVAFGTVSVGSKQTRNFYVDYAGGMNWRNWRIIDIQSEASFFSASMREVTRQPGSVRYEIALSLKEDVPAGYLKEFIDLVTNDPNPGNQHCPVPVSGLVEPTISVKPSPLSFGLIQSAEPVQKTVVIAGQNPFMITGIQSSDPRVTAVLPKEAKTVHILPLRFQQSALSGKFSGTIRFSVNTQPVPVSLTFTGESVPSVKEEESEIIETAESTTPASQPQEISPAQRFFPPQKQQEENASPEAASADSEQTPKAEISNSTADGTSKVPGNDPKEPLDFSSKTVPGGTLEMDAPALDTPETETLESVNSNAEANMSNANPLAVEPVALPVSEGANAEGANAGKTPLFQRIPPKQPTSKRSTAKPAAQTEQAEPTLPGSPEPVKENLSDVAPAQDALPPVPDNSTDDSLDIAAPLAL